MQPDKPERKKKNKPAEPAVMGEAGATVLPPSGLAEDVLGTPVRGEPSSPSLNGVPPNGAGSAGPGLAQEEAEMKFVTFFLEKEEYALPIHQVQEINRVGDITRVPNSPEHVIGVINLRGKIVPVVELKRRLKLGETKIDKSSRVVVVEHGPKLLGLLVDRVAQVINLPASRIEAPPEEVVKIDESYIQAVGKIDDRMIILLELAKVVGK